MSIESASEGESRLRRPPAPRLYAPTAAILQLPAAALVHTLTMLQGLGRIEGCCLWYGHDVGKRSGRVEAVVVPKQRGTWGNYEVSSNSVMEASTATRTRGWVCLAQVHSHPGVDVEHSTYDDTCAISRGALSLVFPRYGRWAGRFPHGIGVHEFQVDYWHLLSTAHAASRIVLDPTLPAIRLDLR